MQEPRSSLLDRLVAHADRPAGAVVLVVLALLEATVFPGPTEAMLVALTLARPRRAWVFAAIGTAASVVGGLIGYHMGAAFYDSAAEPLLASYGMLGQVAAVQAFYRDNALLALATSGWTPVPYMLYTTLAGAGGLPLPLFVAGSLLGRGIKYGVIALLAYLFGPAVHRLLARMGKWALAVVVAGIVIAIVVSR